MASSTITRRQGAGGTAMAHGSRRKGSGVLMASIALRGGGDMRSWLAGGRDAMATRATAGHGGGDRIVIKGGARESRRALMAGIALRRSRHVVRRFS